jgi:hypothetical protein
MEAGSQVNAYKIFDDYNRKNNNILIASENPRIWHDIIIWLYHLGIKFSSDIIKVGLYIIHKCIYSHFGG